MTLKHQKRRIYEIFVAGYGLTVGKKHDFSEIRY